MRRLILLALLAAPSSSLAQPDAGPSDRANKTPLQAPRLDCQINRVEHAVQRGPARAQRLDELPSGNLHLAVQRHVAGCNEPVIVRYDIGKAEPRRR